MKRLLSLLLGLSIAVAPAWLVGGGQASAEPDEPAVSYSVTDARAYAYKAGLREEVISLLPPCDPEADPYECNNSKYNRKENCPRSIELGREQKAPEPKPPKEAAGTKGGAGDHSGADERPEEGTPIQLDRLLSAAKISHVSGLLEAGGLASSLYVDVSGRSEPEAHTQSEAFAPNFASYEERCYSGDDREVEEDNYEHFLSRSFKSPATYHLSECVGERCQLGLGFSAERARQIVSLKERGATISGRLHSMVDGLTSAEGALRVDSLVTYVRFSSDGTREGLKWEAVTMASGATIADQPVALPPGETVAGPGFSVGVAEPYVDASEDGTKLTISALGLHFGNREQNAFFAGAEVVASFGEDAGFEFPPFDEPGPQTGEGPGTGASGGFGPTGGFGPIGGGTAGFEVGGQQPGDTGAEPPPASVAAGEPEEILIYDVVTGIGIAPLLVGLGMLGWMMLLSRWLQRYSWARRLVRVQPFRMMDWFYRAFIKA